jgi:hypothetical protein
VHGGGESYVSCSLSTISSRSYCLYSLAHISTSGRTTRSRKFANVLTVLISKTLELARSCVPVPVPGALRRNPPCPNHGTAVTALLHACDAMAYMRAHGRHAHAFHSVPQQLLPLRYGADASGRLPLRVLRRRQRSQMRRTVGLPISSSSARSSRSRVRTAPRHAR